MCRKSRRELSCGLTLVDVEIFPVSVWVVLALSGSTIFISIKAGVLREWFSGTALADAQVS
jgi:hypothetical protein